MKQKIKGKIALSFASGFSGKRKILLSFSGKRKILFLYL
jgi:hypothetical protein